MASGSSKRSSRVQKPIRGPRIHQSINVTSENRRAAATAASITQVPTEPTATEVTFASFAESFFFLLFVQTEQDVFDLAYNKLVSRDLSETVNNGNHFDFDELKTVIEDLRAIIKDRRLLSSKTLLAPPEPTEDHETTMTAGYNAQVSGTKDGLSVVLTVVAVGQVLVSEDGTTQLALENIVLSTGPEI